MRKWHDPTVIIDGHKTRQVKDLGDFIYMCIPMSKKEQRVLKNIDPQWKSEDPCWKIKIQKASELGVYCSSCLHVALDTEIHYRGCANCGETYMKKWMKKTNDQPRAYKILFDPNTGEKKWVLK